MGSCCSRLAANGDSTKFGSSNSQHPDAPYPGKQVNQLSPVAAGNRQVPSPPGGPTLGTVTVSVNLSSSGEIAAAPSPGLEVVAHQPSSAPRATPTSTLSASERRFGRFYPDPDSDSQSLSYLAIRGDSHNGTKLRQEEGRQPPSDDKSSSDNTVDFRSVRSRASV